LRLSGTRREAFERVKDLQHVPTLRSLENPPEARKALAALSGLVYAAVLDPQYLLVAEDHLLLAKHNFLGSPSDKSPSLFADSSLIRSNRAPGSRFAGGFARLGEVSQVLNRRKVHVPAGEAPAFAPLGFG